MTTSLLRKKASDAQRSKKEKSTHYPLSDIQKILIFEDDNWLVCNKPSGIAMHPGQKHITDLSLHDIMKSYFQQTEQKLATETFSPSFCFRLDRDTTGIVIAAKTYPALQHLNELIRERKTSKTYLAIVAGIFPEQATVDALLFKGFDKKSGRGKMFINKQKWVEARTDARLLYTRSHKDLWDISLVEVQLHTGRMHQIRIHLAHIGYPILGDLMYGDAAINRIATKKAHITRQLLHSRKYWFFDPFVNTEVKLTAPTPDTFTQLFPASP